MSERERGGGAPSSSVQTPAAWNRRAALGAGAASLAMGAALSGNAAAQTAKRAQRGAGRPAHVNVTEPPYGAAGDGRTDDRAAIQAAIDAVAIRGGGCVYLPAGTYLIGAEPSGLGGLQLKSRVMLQGESPRTTLLKLANGANRHVIYGPAEVEQLTASGSPGGLESWSLVNIEIDGNRANNRTGNGLWIYGYKPFVENLFIGNVAEHGWRTEWGGGGPKFGMEGIITSVHIDTCGKHGFWFNGPHDSVVTSVFVIDASQDEHNRWDGFHLDRDVGSRFIACHAWTRANAVRSRYAVYDTAGATEFISCHFEGAYGANVYAGGQGSTFDNCRIFAAAGGRNVIVKATEIVMKARIGVPLEGARPSMGLILGETDKDWVAACDIDVFVTGQAAGAVDFTHSSGTNSVRVRGFQSEGMAYVGKPKATDEVDFFSSGRNGTAFRQSPNGKR